jgi:hypothetical protein
MVNYLIDGNGALGPTDCRRVGPNVTGCYDYDIRENSYALMYVALDGLFDPNPTQAAAAAAAVSLDMQNRWTPSQQAAGEWVMGADVTGYASWINGFTVTAQPGYSTITAQPGSTFNQSSFPAPPFSAGSPPLAIWLATGGTALPASNAQGDTAWYYVQYLDSTHLQLIDTNGNPVNYVAGTACSAPSCSGLAWSISGLLGYGSQPFMVGIQNRAFYLVNQLLASNNPATSQPYDPVNANLASGYTLSNANWFATTGLNSNTKGLYYGRAFVDCEPPSKAYPGCDSGLYADRELNGEGLNVATTAYILNPGAASIKTLGDLMMSAMFSCTPAAPGYDGVCIQGDQAVPTGFMYSGGAQHKWWGYYWGIGANWSWASARLGGVSPPIPRVVQVSLNLGIATQAVLTLVRPDGTSSQVTCTSSPCAVTIDAREGDHLLSINYLDPYRWNSCR